jgi:hypothetical protein
MRFSKILALSIFIFFVVVSQEAMALSLSYKEALRHNLNIIIDLHPKYVWGGSEIEGKGLDCSGYLYLAAKRSGMPVKRVTSIMIESGLGGWSSKKISLDDVDEFDINFWTFKPARMHGHLGFYLVSRKSGLLEITHSSSSKGVIIQPITPYLLKTTSSIRRLTLGDKK